MDKPFFIVVINDHKPLLNDKRHVSLGCRRWSTPEPPPFFYAKGVERQDRCEHAERPTDRRAGVEASRRWLISLGIKNCQV